MANVYDLSGNVKENVKLPKVFSTKYRPDVIKRAILAIQSEERQQYGSDPIAGKKSSAHYHGRRKYRFTMMNKEMARISRIHGKVGYMAFRARVVPQATKGRKAHPPKAEKIWIERINKKEKILALKSALAASSKLEIVNERGHRFTGEVPIILIDDFENLEKSKDVKKSLSMLADEFERCSKKKVRAGKGKMRGRKYRRKTGALIILSKGCKALKAAKNLPGVETTTVADLSVKSLAPGTHAGRLVITTKSALQEMEKRFGV